MPFPEIQHCLICEDVRFEQENKLSLMGFYGFAPYVEIRVRDFGRPMEKLTFVLSGPLKGGGKFKVSFSIRDPEGKSIVKAPDKELVLPEGPGNAQIVLMVRNLKFPGPGEYNFEMLRDEEVSYKGRINMKKMKQ